MAIRADEPIAPSGFLQIYGASRVDREKPDRALTSAFLETILLHEPFRSAQTRRGVRIIGARFEQEVNLNGAMLERELWLDQSRFESGVQFSQLKTPSLLSFDGSVVAGELNMSSAKISGELYMRDGADFADVFLRGARIGGQLSMNGSKFTGKLDMDSAEIGGDLIMRGGAEFNEVVLRGARIGDQLTMIGSKFTGKLNMDSAEIGGDLIMRGSAEFNEVVLRGARIGDQLTMIGSKFTGTLDMGSTTIGSDLFMRGGAEFADVDLRGARIGDQLGMSGSKFTGSLNIDSAEIGGSLFMRGGGEFGLVTLYFAEIGLNLDISGATFADLDLTGTRIGGELRLGSAIHDPTKWSDGGRLTLRNVDVDALQDHEEAWPTDIELDGLTYNRLGGFAADSETDMLTREGDWFVGWLARDASYSPQPHEQLGHVLRAAGREDVANDVLYAGRRRSYGELQSGPVKMLEYFEMAIVGFGYRNWYAAGWAALFSLFGAGVLFFSGEGRRHNLPVGLSYSVDMLIPLVKLRSFHYDEVDLEGV